MLKLQNVTVTYPDGTAGISNLGFTLNAEETIALIGENGAGKTTLLLALAGILVPSEGSIEINGIRFGKKTVKEARRQIGLVFQNPDDQLFMPMIYDDIAFGCRNYGLTEQDVNTRVEETLKRLNISRLKGRSSLKLSGGEKRMAAIATVLAMDPAVLCFDEPTAYLDPKAKRALSETLSKLRHPKIIATHDMEFAQRVCTRAIILKEGRIMADGAVSLIEDGKFMRDCGL